MVREDTTPPSPFKKVKVMTIVKDNYSRTFRRREERK